MQHQGHPAPRFVRRGWNPGPIALRADPQQHPARSLYGPVVPAATRHLSHSWLEADVDGRWRRVDAYINDDAFCQAAAREPGRHGWPEGCSLAGTYRGGEAIDLDAGQFIQMEAVEGDGGVWTEPADYYQSTHYRNRAGPIRAMLYRHVISSVNRRIASLREAALASGSPGA